MSAPAAKLSPQALEDLAFLRHAEGVQFKSVKQLGPEEWRATIVHQYQVPGIELQDVREEWHLGGSAEEALARARAAVEQTSAPRSAA
jgi:hypothetical protein